MLYSLIVLIASIETEVGWRFAGHVGLMLGIKGMHSNLLDWCVFSVA